MLSMSFKPGKQMLYNILFDGVYFLLAVMVEGDTSSQLRMANQPADLASYQSLLTALAHTQILLHRWGPRKRILGLLHKKKLNQKFRSVCGTGYILHCPETRSTCQDTYLFFHQQVVLPRETAHLHSPSLETVAFLCQESWVLERTQGESIPLENLLEYPMMGIVGNQYQKWLLACYRKQKY